jgi:hypothetical protein
VSLLEEALLIGAGVGVGALHMSEELVLDEVLGNGAAVLDHERTVGPLSSVVDRPCHQLFSRAGLAIDDDRHVVLGDDGDLGQELLDLGAGSDDEVGLPAAHDLVPDLTHLVRGAVAVDRLAYPLDQLLDVEGLGHVVGDPVLHQPDRLVDLAVGGHYDHRDIGIELGDGAGQLVALHLRHPHVGDDEIEHVLADEAQPLVAVGRGDHVIALALEARAQHPLHADVIVDNEHLWPGRLLHQNSSISFFLGVGKIIHHEPLQVKRVSGPSKGQVLYSRSSLAAQVHEFWPVARYGRGGPRDSFESRAIEVAIFPIEEQESSHSSRSSRASRKVSRRPHLVRAREGVRRGENAPSG